MSQLKALGRVLRDRLAELDAEIIRTTSERESAWLWRVRSGVRKLINVLVGYGEK